MKKYLLIVLVFIACITLVGCKKDEKKDEESQIVGGWEIVLSKQAIDLDEETLKIFDNAKVNYSNLMLDPVALLGKQVVAGTNYMFLVKGYQYGENNKATYKVVIVYHNLEGVDTITKVSDFDYTKYVNERIEAKDEQLAGGWMVESSGRPYTLFEDGENNFFEKATETLTGMNYKPVALLGKQVVAGTNYAVLCYGAATVPDAKEGIYLLTIYEDLKGTSEIVSSAYIDLADFNK